MVCVSHKSTIVLGLIAGCLLAEGTEEAEVRGAAQSASADKQEGTTIWWGTDYGQALRAAEREKKMVLIVFHRPEPDAVDVHFQNRVLTDPEVCKRIEKYVCVRLPIDTVIRVQGKEQTLLQHPSFAPVQGRPGVVILEYANPEAPYYGCVVGAFPFEPDACYSVLQMKVILDLPPGSFSQRQEWYVKRVRQEVRSFSQPQSPSQVPLKWYEDYAAAYRAASQHGRMLLILFADSGEHSLGNRFEREVLSDESLRETLQEYVLVKLPRDAKMTQGGQSFVLLEDAAFSEMLGLEGVAMIDLMHRDRKEYGTVVSVFPFLDGHLYTLEQTRVMLTLPPGSLTQRTLIYAVRTHPEAPASTTGDLDPILAQEAENHSVYQARIRLQGHHQWGSRFQRISQLLPRGLLAQEVCAESWPGQNLLQAAIECVRSWRLSSGHWSAVRAPHPRYGYDMKKGANGVWYATGIFGRPAN